MQTKKRVYVGLLILSLTIIFLFAFLLWFIMLNREVIISQVLLVIIIIVIAFFLILLALGILAIILMIIKEKNIKSLEGFTRRANEILFPITLLIGKIFGIHKEKIMRSFIEVNNYLVLGKKILYSAKKIIILLPHCLQNTDCPHKITIDLKHCKKCGKCDIGNLIDLADKYGATLKVATGGTLARQYIKNIRPHGVIAVACERDLSLGIQDAGFLPVLGVLNCRPNGPCVNTRVNLDEVEEAIKKICKVGILVAK